MTTTFRITRRCSATSGSIYQTLRIRLASRPLSLCLATLSKRESFLESLLFDYGRYLFIASSRPGSLPPNLQGMWTESMTPAWSSDYHLDINLQM